MSEAKEVNCQNCSGACCRRFTLIHLSEAEADMLEDAGAVMRELDPEDEESTGGLLLMGGRAVAGFFAQVPEGHKVFGFINDCPFLVTQNVAWPQCAIFDSPLRPGACGKFRVDSPSCHEARESWEMWQDILDPNKGDQAS